MTNLKSGQIFSSRKSFFLCSGLLTIMVLTACATPPPTGHAVNGHHGDLVYLGRDPAQRDHSLMRVRQLTLVVFDGVENPSADSMQLLNHTHINPGESVLDMGTGTGVQAIFAARNAKYVVATDINPRAADNARFNIQQHGLGNRINVRVGNLFAPLSKDERFDVILLNLRYPNRGKDSPLWAVHQRFFANVRDHLKPNGRIYYQFGFLHNLKAVEKMLADNGLYISDKHVEASTVLKDALFLTLEIRAAPRKATP